MLIWLCLVDAYFFIISLLDFGAAKSSHSVFINKLIKSLK